MLPNHLCNCGSGPHVEQFCETILNLKKVVQEEMLFKDVSYLELWQPLCSVDWKHLCNFAREHHEEQFCEIILNLDQWIRCCLKTFLI